jgi:starvation-inducible DNA-binding protein
MNYLNIKPETVEDTVKSLNQLLADYQIYYQNLRRFHWNISGENFFDLHDKFEDLYNDAKVNIDEIAERILTLRKKPMSTLELYMKHSNLKETEANSSTEMVAAILNDHRVIIENLRKVITEASEVNDEGTIDLVAGFLSSIEKKSWMLDAWLNRS